MIQEIKTVSEFQSIKPLWDDLYDRAGVNNLFVTHTWLTLWIRHFSDDHTFALLHSKDDSKLDAGVVLKQYNNNIGFIENDFSAYPDFLAVPHSIGCIQSLLSYLKGTYFPSKMIFAETDINSVLCKNVKSLVKNQWVPIFKYHSQMRSVVFSGTFDSYLKSQGKKFRSEIRRKVKRAEKNHRVSLKIFSRSNERIELFNVIRTIEQDSWKALIKSAIIFNEKQLHFYNAVFECYAEQNKAAVYVLYFDDQPVSFVFGIFSGRRYYALKTSYRLLYREYSPGLILFIKLIESFYKNKESDRLEFLGSDARWKEEFSNHYEICCTLELYPMGIKALSYNMLYLYVRPLVKRFMPGVYFL